MTDDALTNYYPFKILENIIHLDLGMRGIQSDPHDNLCLRTQGNLLTASQKITEKSGTTVGVVTGFFIPHGKPPSPETDGPIGSLALAKGLNLLGFKVLLITDSFCIQPLSVGYDLFPDEMRGVEMIEFPIETTELDNHSNKFFQKNPSLEFLIAIERVGPSHDLNSFLKQAQNKSIVSREDFERYGPKKLANQCLNMRGESVSAYTAPIHKLFEYIDRQGLPIMTIGIGDGGNEIGMGSISWEVIHKNIKNGLGGKIACRIPTDYTIVAGVSNWGGYALLAAMCILLKKQSLFLKIIHEEDETALIQHLTHNKLAIDGRLGHPNMSVDGMNWEVHLAIIELMREVVANTKAI